jgi:hypothetical protein
MFHKTAPEHTDFCKSNASFVFRCGLALNREQEYSGQQVMSYLMGKGDTIQSHTYSPIYWSSVVSALKKRFPELQSRDEMSKTVSEQQSEETSEKIAEGDVGKEDSDCIESGPEHQDTACNTETNREEVRAWCEYAKQAC